MRWLWYSVISITLGESFRQSLWGKQFPSDAASVKMHLLLKSCQDFKEILVLKLAQHVHQVSQVPEIDHPAFMFFHFYICSTRVIHLFITSLQDLLTREHRAINPNCRMGFIREQTTLATGLLLCLYPRTF